MRHANLSDCDLTGANLSGTDLTGSELTGAKIDDPEIYAQYRDAIEARKVDIGALTRGRAEE